MDKKELIEVINNISDSSMLMQIHRYTQNLLMTVDGNIIAEITETTEVENLSYGDRPIEIEDIENVKLPWA